jgi:hypothetical protein
VIQSTLGFSYASAFSAHSAVNFGWYSDFTGKFDCALKERFFISESYIKDEENEKGSDSCKRAGSTCWVS